MNSTQLKAPILGVDPGRDKTGLAVVAPDGAILHRAIVPSTQLNSRVAGLLESWRIERIVLGNSTSSKSARAQLDSLEVEVELVDEKNSTLEARGLYFREFPPRGWKRLIPLSAQVPPVPVDDFAAVVVARRALNLQANG